MPTAFWMIKMLFWGDVLKTQKLDTFVLIKAQNLNTKTQTGFRPNNHANQNFTLPAHLF